VQCRIPCVKKAEDLLGFKAETSLEKSLDEVIPWVIEMVKLDKI